LLLLFAQTAFLELFRLPHTVIASIDRQEVAQLFVSDSPATPEARRLFGGFDCTYSWTGSENPSVSQRLATLTGGHVNAYRFRGMRDGEHAVDYFARCVNIRPLASVGSFIAEDTQWFDGFKRQHRLVSAGMVIHTGSGAAKKNWQGFAAVVRHCRERYGSPTILLRGPAEVERDISDYQADVVADGLSLPQVVALLRRSRFYIGNDSGISHLAGAVGTAGMVLFGPTDPAVWAPRSRCLHVLHASAPCPHCGPETFCTHRLSVSTVIDTLDTISASRPAD